MTIPHPLEISIRPQQESDAAAIALIRNDKRARWGTLATPYESAERWCKFGATPATGRIELVACVNDEIVAAAGIFRHQQPRRNHVAGVGISIRDHWQGRGIGTKLFAALTDLADNWLNISRLELNVNTDNHPAIALYKKFGFVTEGTEVADIFRDGGFADSYIMGRLKNPLPRDEAPYPALPPQAPATPFTLRAAEPSDATSITNLMNLPCVRHGTLRTPFSTIEEAQHLATPTNPATRSIIATTEEQIIGLIHITPGKNRRAHTGEIAILAVHDSHRKRGVGQALLTAALDIAGNWLNLTRIHLAVTADNATAIALYEKAGFVIEGLKIAATFRAGAYADTQIMARVR